MKNIVLFALGLFCSSMYVGAGHAQGGDNAPLSFRESIPSSFGQWQNMPVSSEPPPGMILSNGSFSFEDWIAAGYKDHQGDLYTRDGKLIGKQMMYSVEDEAVGSYVFDPVITSDKVFFHFGNLENPMDGFNLLYIDKVNGAPISVHRLNPATRLYYNRVELSRSSRYIAYMTGGVHSVFHDGTMALCVTDVQASKIARVDAGDWIMGTYWWDGDTLRFLKREPERTKPDTAPPRRSRSGVAKVPTRKPVVIPVVIREFIQAKQFDVKTGKTQVVRTQLYQKNRFDLENYYNAFFGKGYSGTAPKAYAAHWLPESVLFDNQRQEILFATRTNIVKEETSPDGRSFYKTNYALISMTGANTFTPIGKFTLRSFEGEPSIKLFRVGKRLFMGVKSYSSVPSNYAPMNRFLSRIMTLYELKNGRAEVIRQEENCFGLSQLIDGTSIFVSY